MKKKYEKKQALFTSIFFLIISYIIFIDIIFTNTYNKYILMNANIVNDKIIDTFITSKELKYLKANHYIYINDKKYKRKIEEVNRNILKQNNKTYHEVKIKVDLNKKYKVGDSITIRVIEKKEKLYKIFKSCWKEK